MISIFYQQTVERIEVIQVVVSPELSKLYHSVMIKNFLTCHPTISYWLMDFVIKLLIHQF